MSQRYPFDDNGNVPPGFHDMSLAEIEAAFTWNQYRRELFQRWRDSLRHLTLAGVPDVFLAGSFFSDLPRPGDVDGYVVVPPDVVIEKALVTYLKEIHGFDLKIDFGEGRFWSGFFSLDRVERERGIVRLNFGGGP